MSKAAAFSWRLGAAEVRDARHVHDGPEVTAAPAKHKDTRRWCKGKIGREHVMAVSIMNRHGIWAELVRHCSGCGKKFGSFHRSSYASVRRNPPDWATKDLLKQLDAADVKLRTERGK